MKSRGLLLGLLGFIACSRQPAPDAGFAGTWVMEVDKHPFMIVTLEPKDGLYAGTLTWPGRKTISGDGRTFSGIGREITTKRLTSEMPRQATLRLVVEPPDDPNDKDQIELTLTAPDEGQLRLIDTPFEPWPVMKNTSGNSPRVWTGWDVTRSYGVREPDVEPNAEMASIYQADQAPRQSYGSFTTNAAQIEKDDAIRRGQVRALLDKGQLRAAEDFRLAALVFQHGSEPRDFLFAHTLALIALEKGDRSASWIAAASLDQYLRSIDRPQIFGLRFERNGIDRQPLDAGLISDALRKQLGVPSLAEQEAQMQAARNK